jgi:hypothetical protein
VRQYRRVLVEHLQKVANGADLLELEAGEAGREA